MIEMYPCPSCTELVNDGTCVCPHCGDKACKKSGVQGAAVLLGLSLTLTGCWTGQAEYGAAVTPTGMNDTADTGDTAAASAVEED